MELQTKMQRLVSAMDSMVTHTGAVPLDSANDADAAKRAEVKMTTTETNLVVY